MPLIAHSGLPSFERLRRDGHDVLAVDRATHQDIRELHIGLLNMMPDAALQATERQFLRLLGACNRIVQFYVHPFTVPGLVRGADARDYVDRYYERFSEVRASGLDALIITGANPVHDVLTDEPFWPALEEVMDWARESVTSTYCSCLASHAAFAKYHGIERTRLPGKQWGVYTHRVIAPWHPLVAGVNTRFETPHSRLNDVPRWALEDADLTVLVHSDEAGVLAAVSPDLLRMVYFQGHPEYDAISLLKEYRREVERFADGERENYPPFPDHYFDDGCRHALESHREGVLKARAHDLSPPRFPEAKIAACVDNTWTDTGKALFNNWLGLVYQHTHQDRRQPFMPEVDPEDPLGLRQARAAAQGSN